MLTKVHLSSSLNLTPTLSPAQPERLLGEGALLLVSRVFLA
jgi:hypothetical protein